MIFSPPRKGRKTIRPKFNKDTQLVSLLPGIELRNTARLPPPYPVPLTTVRYAQKAWDAPHATVPQRSAVHPNRTYPTTR